MLEVDVIDGSTVSMVEPYWLRRVWRLTLDDIVIRWRTLVSVGGATTGTARGGGSRGWVETIPWCGRGFWRTMGGGLGGVGLG